MILDQLISAYLDGDLSPEQDRDLREQLRRDPASREAFDAAVLIHIAMRCEDDTMPPERLRAGIFDAVDAIAADAHLATFSPVRPAVRSSRRLRPIATIAVLLLCFWLPIREGALEQLGSSEQRAASSEPQPLAANSNSQQPTATANSNSNSQQPTATANSQQPTATANSQQPTATAHSQPSYGLSDGQMPEVPLRTFFGGSLTNVITSAVPTANDPWATSEPPQPVRASEAPLHVTVATTYAAGMTSSLAAAQDLRQVSASIAYGLTERDALGLEIGATSYSIEQSSAMITTSESFSSTMRTSINDGTGSEKLASPEVIREDYGRGQMQHTAIVHSGWGTAFYERSLVATDRLGLTGRAGIGASDAGFLGFGRLTGSLDLGSGFSVMVGAEARAMPFQTGAGAAVSSQITYGTVLTALTGLRVRF